MFGFFASRLACRLIIVVAIGSLHALATIATIPSYARLRLRRLRLSAANRVACHFIIILAIWGLHALAIDPTVPTNCAIMVMMVMMGRLRAGLGLRAGLRAGARTVAVGTEHIACSYAVGTAPEFGSGASAHVLRIVRTGMRTRFVSPARVGRRLFAFGRV